MVYVFRDLLQFTQIHEQVKHVCGFSANTTIGIVLEQVKVGGNQLQIFRFVEKTDGMRPHAGIRVREESAGKVIKADEGICFSQSLKPLEQELLAAECDAGPDIQYRLEVERPNIRKLEQIAARVLLFFVKQGIQH